jgi:tRNA-specific 2-thiouridylase
MRVCATLGVPFLTLDCEKEYKEMVVDYMLSEYKAGRTPNPDVFCNKYVKFGVFLKRALEMGADYVATGHYAQIEKREMRNEKRIESDSHLDSHISYLYEASDKEKDQSYFLHQLSQEQLAHVLFPIGHLHKTEVRELAKKFGLPTAEKKDSQGLCFIGKVDMKEFLAHYMHDNSSAKPGDVLDESGAVIGSHDGAVFYTIGERHGFMITSQNITEQTQNHGEKDENRPRYYVVAKDIEKNTITVGLRKEKREMRKEKGNKKYLNASSNPISYLISHNSMNWISGNEPSLSNSFDVRFRYRQEKQKCNIVKTDSGYEIIPERSQFGIAPGQSAVIYVDDVCLGGGILD